MVASRLHKHQDWTDPTPQPSTTQTARLPPLIVHLKPLTGPLSPVNVSRSYSSYPVCRSASQSDSFRSATPSSAANVKPSLSVRLLDEKDHLLQSLAADWDIVSI